MMFASLLTISQKDAAALRITDTYSLHRVVYSLYDDVRTDSEKKSGLGSGILFSTHSTDSQNLRIIMLSSRPPADSIEGRYGSVAAKQVPAEFLEFQDYQLKVVVNPVRRSAATKKAVPIRDHEEIKAWFSEKSEKSWGFRVQGDLQVERVDVERFRDKNKQPVTIAKATVVGRIHVTDKDLFVKSFSSGLGRGRTFGCGLMQLQPFTKQSPQKDPQ